MILNQNQEDAPVSLLLVDDKPDNLDVLIKYLENTGYSLAVALNGQEALALCEKKTPDVILLDVMMPGIDGFETCRRLKQQSQFADIPVIFMTALADTANKIEGFEAGGVDYITKPIQQEEVLARVKIHATIRRQQKELLAKNKKMEELNREKNEFLGIAAHDLKNPLALILDFSAELAKSSALEPEKVQEMSGYIHSSAAEMLELITNLLDINRLDSGKTNIVLQAINLLHPITVAVEMHRQKAQTKGQTLEWAVPSEPHIVQVDENAFMQVMNNLLSNAVKYTPFDKNIAVRLYRHEHYIRVEIKDEGLGLTLEDKQLLFNKFAKLGARPTGGEHSSGLGLSIVKRLVEGMKGRVWAESEGRGRGSCFFVEFPSQAVSTFSNENAPTQLILPPEKFVVAIRECADIGDILGLQQTLHEIQAQGEVYEAFTRQIQHFLEGFRFREIRAYLEEMAG